MISLALATLRGFLRDRVFQGIMVISCLFLVIPAISNISIRQISEMSISLSLSLSSFVLLLLAVFLGGTTLWRDIERRYTYSVLGLPLSRSDYLLGRFLGVVLCLLLAAFVLSMGATLSIILVSHAYPPDRPLRWLNIALALSFDALKYILLVSLAFLFSSLSTSFFLPVFGTISFFWLGSVSQQVYNYLHSPLGADTTPLVRNSATLLYYIIPNFTPFNLKSQAVYSLDLSIHGVLLTTGYGVLLITILLSLACMIFSRREFQ